MEEGHVGADLVEAAGFDGDTDEGGGRRAFLRALAYATGSVLRVGEDFVGGDGFLALAGDDDFFDGALAPGFGVGVGDFDFFEAGLDDALHGAGDAGGEGQVFLVDVAGFEVARSWS